MIEIFFSEFIGDDAKWWFPRDVVKIQAPTGSGKTTYILEHLRREAIKKNKNVLYFYNRRLLGQQLQTELGAEIGWNGEQEDLYQIKEFDGIKLCSYQSLQKILQNQSFNLNDCCYVVLDEVHYILRDSLFQPEIAFLIEWLNHKMMNSNVVWIFVSATIELTWNFLMQAISTIAIISRGEGGTQALRDGVRQFFSANYYGFRNFRPRILWEYNLPTDYTDYDLFYFHSLESLIPVISQDTSGKWLIFVQNRIHGQQLAMELIRFLGEGRVQYLDSQLVNEGCDITNQIAKQKKFEGQVLVTTSVLDNGITINDYELRNIVISTTYHDDFIQMIGRKRKELGERVNVYVSMKSVKELAGEIHLKYDKIINFMQYDDTQICNSLIRNTEFSQFGYQFLCYDVKQRRFYVNPAGRYIISCIRDFLQAIKNMLQVDEYFFVRQQLIWLGKPPEIDTSRCVEMWLWKERMGQLSLFLDALVNQPLDKSWQKTFSYEFQKFIDIPLKIKTFGLHRINNFLVEQSLPYYVESTVVSRKTVWTVRRIGNEIKSLDA